MSEQLSPAAWAALSSPSRLQVLLLCESAPQNWRTLAEQLELTRNVVRRHLAALQGAGLIYAVSEEAVTGGRLVSYRSVRPGWAHLVNEISALARVESSS